MRLVVGFARFWYDFVVGDSIVLAVGGLATLVLGWLMLQAGWDTLAEFALPGIVVVTLALSLPRRPRS